MLKRLRIKFVCTNMIIVTVMLCIIFGTVLHFTRQNLERDSLSMMRTVAMSPMHPGHPKASTEEIRLPFFVLQVGPNGRLLAAGGGYYDLSDENFLQELIDRSLTSNDQTGVIPEYALRFCRVVTPNSQLLVFADMSSEIRTMENLLKSCLLIGSLSFLVFLLISLLLARWAVKPVEKAWKQQKQFVADASHELKTPLTVIITNAELLRSPGYEEADRARFTDSILTMSHQMRGLVESLLDMARIDNGTIRQSFSELDLSQLTESAVLPFEAVFFEKGLDLQCTIEKNISMNASAPHLRQLIDILLDNAQKYSLPQSQVQLELKRSGRNACLLSVATAGEPLSKEDLKHIFKRFYRIDPARTMDRSYGLGLSIAQSIVLQHNGKIWAESTGGTNIFFVQLPSSKAAVEELKK